MLFEKSDKQVYEAHCIDPDGHVGFMEVLECDSDEEAMQLAATCGKLHHTVRARVYRVPYINMSGTASQDLWPDQVEFIGEIPIDDAGEVR